ncbi:2-phospho-L-lactate transferase [Amnibacterium flavum]|uniref:2-phospho-L-lactate transferase n=1 Tax=Amnibacterium flavum TaxID=2173173 RepID=A0A2V1HXK9_9MICO|nr:2-phospho-L-lactate transferase [Amnibacterium flavum]PVZ96050.1 2-phospho-L-lactate transferase [Amnibacterium flavum]
MTEIVVLAGGVGGARYLRGVREAAARRWPDGSGGSTAHITAIVNTGDDAWLAGLRITPDLDSVMYTLAGVSDEQRGWGRVGETERVSAELREYGVGWPWFTLGDLDLGTHIARTSWLREGEPLSAVVKRLQSRWPIGIDLVPMTDAEVETNVQVADETSGSRLMHFQEWWTRHRAGIPAERFVQVGIEGAVPAPGVLDAIEAADALLIAPSNPVVSIGTILAVPGLRDALRSAPARVVGVSPIIAGAAVRGMADACLQAIHVETSATGVALHYGARDGSADGLLDGWLVDTADADAVGQLDAAGITTISRPLFMTDLDASAEIAGAALDLALART